MTRIAFTSKDFDVFLVPGLEARMEALKKYVRPKLEIMGDVISPTLTALIGEPVFPHVAKHARRTVHPPNDTWVAWATNKRGYKAHPHFQVGLWSSHLFILFALIYECPHKPAFARSFKENYDEIRSALPDHFVLSWDHTKPGATPLHQLNHSEVNQGLDRLETVKKAEFLCGVHLDRHDPIVGDSDQLLHTVEQTFTALYPLYRLAMAHL